MATEPTATKITVHHKGQGDFVYERDPDEPFIWRLTWPNGVTSKAKFTGHEVLWECARSVIEGTDES